jgi:hypothetical protein
MKTSNKAVRFWEQRDRFGRDRVYAFLMSIWTWEHHDLCEAFGSIDALARALREVAPPLALEQPLPIWRGVWVVSDEHPAECASGLSWTKSFDVACWFATAAPRFKPGRPFVFELNATTEEIIAFHQGGTAVTATEDEALLEPAKLDRLTHTITVAGTNMTVADLRPDSRISNVVLSHWREAATRYHERRYTRG